MKAVIVQCEKKYAAALDDAGTMHKIKNKKYALGQVITMEATVKKSFVTRYAAAAAIAVVIGLGAWGFFSPYSYVSLDVNPSIEYSVNRFGLVLSAQAVNGDGEEILQNLNLKYSSIGSALEQTVDEITAAGYFEGTDPGQIMIATACKNDGTADQLREQLQTRIMDMEQIQQRAVEVQGVAVGYNLVQEARDLGLTPGKLNLIERLIASSDDPSSVNIEDWRNVSVKDIMKTINTNNGNGSTNGNGNGSSDSMGSGTGSGSPDSSDNGNGYQNGTSGTDGSSDTTDTTAPVVTTNGNGSGNGNSDNGSGGSGKGK